MTTDTGTTTEKVEGKKGINWKVLGYVALAALALTLAALLCTWSIGQVTKAPAPAAPVVEQPAPQAPAVIVNDPGQTRETFNRAQVDAVLGAGNWACFPDRIDGIAVRSVPENYVVTYPLSAVDKGTKYVTGEAVPGTGGATAWLAGTLASREECPPAAQSVAAPQKTDASITGTGGGTDAQVCNVAQLKDVPGVSSVKVLDSANGAAKVTVSREVVVPAGWTVDRQGNKYLPGQTIGDGEATWWAPECGKPLK